MDAAKLRMESAGLIVGSRIAAIVPLLGTSYAEAYHIDECVLHKLVISVSYFLFCIMIRNGTERTRAWFMGIFT